MPLRRRHGWQGTFCTAGALLALASCSGPPTPHPDLAEEDEPGAISGELTVYIADYEDGTSETSYFLRDARGDERRLHFSSPPDVAPGSNVHLWGNPAADALDVVRYKLASKAGPEALGSQSAPLIGVPPQPPRVLCSVLVTLNGGAVPQNLGITQLEAQFHSGPTSVNAYYVENSYGRNGLGGTSYGPFDYAFTGCDTSGLAKAIKPLITDHCDQYGFLMVPRTSGCSWAGLGQVGTATKPATDTWYNGTLGCVATVQEPGHNYGMNHSSSITCGSSPFLDDPASCTHSEYGDRFDTMGGGCRHMNVWQKQYQGWFGGCNAIKVGMSGTFNLLATEQACDGVQSMQLPFPAGKTRTWQGVTLTSYYLELRTSTGFDMGMTPQVLVHTGTDAVMGGSRGAPHTWIINASGNANNPGLVANGTFSDPAGGLSITVTAISSDAATIAVNYTNPVGGASCLDGAMLAPPGPTTCTGPVIIDGGPPPAPPPAPPVDAGSGAAGSSGGRDAGRDASGGAGVGGSVGAGGTGGAGTSGIGGSGVGGSDVGSSGVGGSGAGGAAGATTSGGAGSSATGGSTLTGAATTGTAGADVGTTSPTATTSGGSGGANERARGSAINDAQGSCTCRIGPRAATPPNDRLRGLLGLGLLGLISRRRSRRTGRRHSSF